MKKLLKKVLPKGAQRTIRRALHGRFYVLQQETDGLMSPRNYEKIYEEVKGLPDLDLVEVGGAGGTASIAICWALKEQRKSGRLVVVEKCEGGSRTPYGGKKENLARYERNTLEHGVAEYIRLFPHYMTFGNGQEVLALVQTPQIAGLFLDADGMIHRDFSFFWPRLVSDGLIVVDDYQENRDPKHDLTFRLLNQLIDWGLFELKERIGNTMFGRKPKGADLRLFDRGRCEAIVAEVCRRHGVIFDAGGISPAEKK